MSLIVDRAETEVPLSLSLTEGGGAVLGATVLVAIRDSKTQDSYLDFNDLTFKTVGWTTREASVAELANGFYSVSGGLDLTAITNLPVTTNLLVAEYRVTAPAASLGSVQEYIHVQADVNVKRIHESETAARMLEEGTRGNVYGTVGVASSSTSIVTSALTPAADAAIANQQVGRILTFREDTTTVALRGQATDITAATASATPVYTVTALTAAPVSGDEFVIT